MIRNYAIGLRFIIITLLLFVITANITLYIFTQSGYTGNPFFQDGVNPFDTRTIQLAHYNYHGFRDFFEFMRTFPGLNMSLSSINEVASIISGQIEYVPNLVVLDYIVKIAQVITLPIRLIFTFLGDIVNIIIWLGRFIIVPLVS